jgi:hypothetical protein
MAASPASPHLTAAEVAKLHTEVTSDPKSLGYAAKIQVGDDTALAALLNQVGEDDVAREPLESKAFIRLLDPAEVATRDSGKHAALQTLASFGSIDPNGQFDGIYLDNVFDKTLCPETQKKRDALKLRKGSRVEALLGTGRFVTAEDMPAVRA